MISATVDYNLETRTCYFDVGICILDLKAALRVKGGVHIVSFAEIGLLNGGMSTIMNLLFSKKNFERQYSA